MVLGRGDFLSSHLPQVQNKNYIIFFLNICFLSSSDDEAKKDYMDGNRAPPRPRPRPRPTKPSPFLPWGIGPKMRG